MASSSDVCAMTIMDGARMSSLRRLSDSWAAPLSVAVLADRNSDEVSWSHRSEEAVVVALAGFRRRELLRATLVENTGFDCPPRFPFNLLRNVALSRCTERRVLVVDVDFVPHPADEALPQRLSALSLAPNEALVLPAFEPTARWVAGHAAGLPAVMSKIDLRALVSSGGMVSFGDPSGTRDAWRAGHLCTKSGRWLNHSKSHEVQHCHPYYEPYLMVPRATIPPFDESFNGRGFDKVSFVYELFARNFTLRTAPEAFVVHLPHAPSTAPTCAKSLVEEAARSMGARSEEEVGALSYNPGEACVGQFVQRMETSLGYAPEAGGHADWRKHVHGRRWRCNTQYSVSHPPRSIILS